jgi:branched-chain amino acid transport system ATP-binding protein
VLFTEHSMEVVFAYAQRMLVLSRGRIIAEGDPASVRENPEVQAVYLGTGAAFQAHAALS